MREVTIKLYKYDEQPNEPAKGNAREWLRKTNEEDSWIVVANIEEATQQVLETLGLGGLKDDVRFRLNHSQGDGVAFYGQVYVRDLRDAKPEQGWKLIEPLKETLDWFKAEIDKFSDDWLDLLLGTAFDIRPNGLGNHYHNHKTMEVDFDEDWFTEGILTDEQREKWQETFKQWLQNISRAMQKMGYEEIEYRETKEFLEEELRANDWEFREDGSFWHG